MKKILITNDDGIFAAGIQILARKFHEEGYDVLVVAPDRERSASGHSMTMDRPLHLKKIDNSLLADGFTAYSCDGTPTDCVIMGCDALKFVPDIVVTGINCGPNLGDDLTYSGTACSAMEGVIFGYPAMAVSLVCGSKDPDKHYETAADAALASVHWLEKHPMGEGVFYNVNVPNVTARELKGVRLTRKGKRRYHDKITVVRTPFGDDAYWVGGTIHDDLSEGSDVWAVRHDYVSITPAHLEMTCFDEYNAGLETSIETTIYDSIREKVEPMTK